MDLLKHYFSIPDFFIFLAISFAVTIAIHLIFWGWISGRKGKSYDSFVALKEEYYELVFAATSTLLFTGIYFIIELQWVPIPSAFIRFWQKYDDVILLVLLIGSIAFINLLDRVIVPLKKLDGETLGSLRMASMIYMLIIFAYIKFIYQDDNYDKIVFYFVTMLIGRFVYLDASFKSFRQACVGFVKTLPILGFVLLSTALLALYGFGSGYLLTSNGVVVSLFIAHCFMIFEIFILSLIEKGIVRKKSKNKTEP